MRKILIIILTLSVFASCKKKTDETPILSVEDKVALINMENSLKEGRLYDDSVKTCYDENMNIIDTALYEFYDSILHACFTNFEHYHGQFGHGNSHCVKNTNESSGMMNGGMMGRNHSSNDHCSGTDAEHGMGSMYDSESGHMDMYYNQMASFSHEMNLLKDVHTPFHH